MHCAEATGKRQRWLAATSTEHLVLYADNLHTWSSSGGSLAGLPSLICGQQTLDDYEPRRFMRTSQVGRAQDVPDMRWHKPEVSLKAGGEGILRGC